MSDDSKSVMNLLLTGTAAIAGISTIAAMAALKNDHREGINARLRAIDSCIRQLAERAADNGNHDV